MLLLTGYESKKELKANIGKSLRFLETSLFCAEYTPNGIVYCAHRPKLNGSKGREFYAAIHMANGLIVEVE